LEWAGFVAKNQDGPVQVSGKMHPPFSKAFWYLLPLPAVMSGSINVIFGVTHSSFS
jgi:hypothetical protein